MSRESRAPRVVVAIAALVAAMIILVSLSAVASDPGSFSAAGSLVVPREYHTATLLPDGRVLIVGGTEKAAPAEVWDPVGVSFSLTPSKASERWTHTATALSDGKVLVVGGFGMKSRLATAELWDPVTVSPTPLASMGEERAYHAAAALRDGRVLVLGGTGDEASLRSAESWDPATAAFTPAGAMAEARMAHTATTLADGRVLVIGGMDETFTALASAELWDPATGAFAPTGMMAEPRGFHVAVLLQDGRVLVAGGLNYAPGKMHVLTGAEVWDPATGTFSAAGSMSTVRYDFTGTLLQDGRVLVAGGWNEGTGEIVRDSADLWDPATETFTPTGTMIEPRMRQTATLLPDGRVLVVGGWRSANTDGLAELFDPGP